MYIDFILSVKWKHENYLYIRGPVKHACMKKPGTLKSNNKNKKQKLIP